ncbi:MAG: hypothetical protein HRF47_18600 [Chloroflexota bacterium]|jgi:hypothetical protein
MFNRRSSKMFVVVLLALVFATAAFAFAATNTVPGTYAGEGAGTVSGYTVTNVVYNLNATNASNIDSVSFTLNAAASTVKVRLVTTGSFYNCTNTSGFNWTCNTTAPQATVAAADELRVIASE